jgi:hypothetical protein
MSDFRKIGRGVLSAGIALTLWSVAIGFGTVIVLATLTWVFSADLNSSLSDVINFSASAFLVMNGIDINFAQVILDLRFTGFIFFIFFVLYKVFKWAFRNSLSEGDTKPTIRALLILVIAISSYTGTVFGIYFWQIGTISQVISIIVWPLALSLISGLAALLAVGGSWTLIKNGLDVTSQNIINATKVALIAIFAFSLSILLWLGFKSWQEINGVFVDLGANIFAIAIIILLGLGWLPNYLVWIWAVLSGVTLNLGTSYINLDTTRITQLPAWPWFAVLPEDLPDSSQFLIVLPILVGVLIAIFSHHQNYANWLVGSFFASLISSGTLGILLWFSNGSLGTGNLSKFGADAIEVFQENFKYFLIGVTIVVVSKILWQRATAPEQEQAESKSDE